MASGRTIVVARWISRVGHPFVLPLVALLIVTLQVVPPWQALGIVALTLVTTTVPLLIYTRRQIRRERWTDYDVSVRQDRYRLYPLLLAVLGLSALVFWFVGGPRFMIRGLLASMVLAFAAMLANLVLKVSLHTALSVFCALVILALNNWLGIGACIFAMLIGWSRVVLKRHTTAEVISGALLGSIVGVALVLSS